MPSEPKSMRHAPITGPHILGWIAVMYHLVVVAGTHLLDLLEGYW